MFQFSPTIYFWKTNANFRSNTPKQSSRNVVAHSVDSTYTIFGLCTYQWGNSALIETHSTVQLMQFLHNKVFSSIQNVRYARTRPERIYNPITAMGCSTMFTFQLDNMKKYTLPEPHCHIMGVVDTFWLAVLSWRS